jgi:hypothetical protein
MSEELEQAAEQPVSDTLLDSAEPTLNEGEYYLTEGIKGHGEKPEWLDVKYKTVADQAKGYAELSKKFGGFKGSPKDGYTTPEGIESDNELYKELEAFATKNNMNADAFGEAWELLSTQNEVQEEYNQQQEINKLGTNAESRIKNVEGFMKNNLSEEKYAEAQQYVTTAESIALVEMLVEATTPTKLPIEGGIHPQGLTWADVEVEMFKTDANGDLLRSTSIAHEKKVQAMMATFENRA